MKYYILLIVQCLFFSAGFAQPETVLDNYREYLFRTHKYQDELVEEWKSSVNAGGQWADINYQDKEPADWEVSKHLKRVRELALSWANPKSGYFHQQDLKSTIDSGLEHWLEKRYRSSNWWHNQIGVPQVMRDIIVLLRKDLTSDQMKQSLEVLAQHSVQNPGVGANLIWSADLGLHYGILTGNEELAQRCQQLIVNEIQVTTGEGIQPDNSFHQHGQRLQMYQYGKAFLWESLRLAWELRESKWAFPEEKVKMLTDLLLEGWQWMARGIHTVPGTMDRSSSRVGELRSPDIRSLIPFIIDLRPEKTEELRAMAEIQNGKGSLEGFRYYPFSDFSVYHHPEFSFFLKTISERTLPTESINNENLKGRLLNSGDGYLIRNGEEYFDLMPLWDWEKLPGVTAFSGADHINRKPFAGSVSNGKSGVSAMDYQMRNKEKDQVLSAHKFWAVHGDVVVCLLADLKAEGIDEFYTALDQSRWQTDVVANKPGNILKEGINDVNRVKWIHHHGFAYIPLKSSAFKVQLKEVAGSWLSINASEMPDTVTEKIFLPVMYHDFRPEGNATGYALASCATPKQAKKLAQKPVWKVLRNDGAIQAVQFDDGVLMAAFFSPGSLEINGKESLEVDQPCLILIENGKIYVSDPTHAGKVAAIDWRGVSYKAALSDAGFTVLAERK